ncbi:MAG: hypothetical protein RL557_242 [archaeon]|jgi:hypothetical protein
MMNKGGQFYLIAAVIIVLILFSLTSVSTYVVITSELQSIQDVSADLQRESYHLIEYGIYNKEDLQPMLAKFSGEDFGDYFLKKSAEGSNILFVYGNKSSMQALQFDKSLSGEVKLGSSSWKNYKTVAKTKDITKSDLLNKDSFEVEFLGNNYPFTLQNNEMFYFVVVSERDGEVFVEKNDKAK